MSASQMAGLTYKRAKTDTSCDVLRIDPRHGEIHARLENWARWGQSGTRVKQVSPMFRQYRSRWRQWHAPEHVMPVFEQDAMIVEKAVMGLPPRFRGKILWFYVWRAPVHIACRAFASTKLDLWIDLGKARDMLDNALPR